MYSRRWWMHYNERVYNEKFYAFISRSCCQYWWNIPSTHLEEEDEDEDEDENKDHAANDGENIDDVDEYEKRIE